MYKCGIISLYIAIRYSTVNLTSLYVTLSLMAVKEAKVAKETR